MGCIRLSREWASSHLGFRDNRLIVTARLRNTVLEYIEPGVFASPAGFDLPAELVENCVHWLDLETAKLEARQKPDIWMAKRDRTGLLTSMNVTLIAAVFVWLIRTASFTTRLRKYLTTSSPLVT